LIEAVIEYALDDKISRLEMLRPLRRSSYAGVGDGGAPGTVYTIPVLGAVFLFGPSLFCLIGIARKKMA